MNKDKEKLEFLKYILLGCVKDKSHIDLFLQNDTVPSKDVIESITEVPKSRVEGLDEPLDGFTMIGLKRLDNLHEMLDYVRINKIDGDLIETGVWRGGATIFMRYYCKLYNLNKKVFVCDSFKGLPKPSGKFDADRGDLHYTYESLSVSLDKVKSNFEKFNCLDNSVIFIEGFFGETLPNNEMIEKISLLRMDGDMYESTHDVFYSIYDKVVDGAPIIIDDYCLNGCKQCVTDFRNNNNINSEIKTVDRCGIYWIK
jgi:O-methyltransferase